MRLNRKIFDWQVQINRNRAFFVKLFDAVCRDLMLSPRDDFGIRETNTNVVKKPSAVDDRMK